MKKLVVLLLAVAFGVVVYRRLSRSGGPATSQRAHQHGTPDHWPPIVRKPGSKTDSTASAA